MENAGPNEGGKTATAFPKKVARVNQLEKQKRSPSLPTAGKRRIRRNGNGIGPDCIE